LGFVAHDLTLSKVRALNKIGGERRLYWEIILNPIAPLEASYLKRNRYCIRWVQRHFPHSALLPYEYALSFLFSLDHGCHLLVDDCIGAKPAEHDAAIAFSDHE
jgi:hypothetical protein